MSHAIALPAPGLRTDGGLRNKVEDLIRFAFGVATVITNLGKAMFTDRLLKTPLTYTESPHFLAMGTGAESAARTAVAGDTALSTEVESRTAGEETTVTTSITKDTYQVKGTIEATAERKVNEAGLFNKSSGVSMFTSATFNVDTLNTSDSITFTWKVQLT